MTRKELVSAFVASGREDGLNNSIFTIAQMTRLEMLSVIWTTRPCFICEKAIPCEHREAEADLAEIDRLLVQPLQRKPPALASAAKSKGAVA